MGPRYAALAAAFLIIAFGSVRAQSSTKCTPEQQDRPSHPHLNCIELLPTPGLDAAGVVRLLPMPSPFGVAVTKDGNHLYGLVADVRGLPDPGSLGPYKTYVAWAADPIFSTIQKLGVIENGRNDLGDVSLNKFLVIISAEATPDVSDRKGQLVLRGQSPSNLLQPHDLLSLSPLAALSSQNENHEGHVHTGDAKWAMPPMHPRISMAPGMTGIEPKVDPFLPTADDLSEIPHARPRSLVQLSDGDTLHLVSGLVQRTLRGQPILMYGFNQQYPGPLILVNQKAEITVHFKNEAGLPTAIHWHGIRLDNRFDGVPGVTQGPVPPGGTFTYQVYFPDAGIYWYHPHHREDIQQDLGLYGNMIVRSSDPDYFNPVNREEVLMLDDLLLDGGELVPYGRQSANFMLMGRFGNVFLINGEPNLSLSARKGEVIRFFLTNVSNTRTFNLSFDGARTKVIGSDIGKFEREEWVSSVVIAPAERYIVETMFDQAGTIALTNRVQAFNHRTGSFFAEVDTLGLIHVREEFVDRNLSEVFETLHENPKVQADIGTYHSHFDRPVDHELVMTLEVSDLSLVVEQMMRFDRVYFNPVEWSDTMPMMNWASTGYEVAWKLRDPATGLENMDIDWRFRRGEVVKIRVHNDRNAFHAMQHPLHIHGQRFLVLSQNGVGNRNLVWKDTVLLPVGSETDLLVDLANPGKWMVHCHIAEHLESGMKMVINVDD